MEIFVFFIACLSAILSIIILKYAYNDNFNIANIMLSAFFMIMGLYGIIHHIINYSKNITLVACVLNIFTPLFILIGPLLYLYTKNVLNDAIDKFSLKDFLYLFIPFIIVVIDLFPHYITSFDEKIKIANFLINDTLNYKGTNHLLLKDSDSTLFRVTVNLIFIACSIYNLISIKISAPLDKQSSKLVLKFLYFLNTTNLFFILFMLLYLLLYLKIDLFLNIGNLSQYMYDASWASHGIIIMATFFYPTVLYNIPQKSTYLDGIISEKTEKKLYKTFSLEDDYKIIIKEKLNYFLESLKIGEDFKLSTLTIETKIPAHHLNLYFKEELNTTFSIWKHNHKLKYALKLINEGSLNHLTIEAIAIKSGFQTYSNFYNVFKEEIGLTPSEYVKNKFTN